MTNQTPTSRRKTPAASPDPTVTMTTVTPTIAAEWLAAANHHNPRHIRPERVRQYANDIRGGRWQWSNDAIAFRPDGELVNGQHRLAAIVEAGQEVRLLVARGVPDLAVAAMDAGLARTAADVLRWRGEGPDAVRMAAAAKILIEWLEHGLAGLGRTRVSHQQIISVIEDYPGLRHSMETARRTGSLVALNVPAAALAHFLISDAVGQEVADDFFHALHSRANLPAGSAILALDNRLRNLRAKRTRLQPRDHVRLYVTAYNAWAEGRPVSRFEAVQRGEFALPVIRRPRRA